MQGIGLDAKATVGGGRDFQFLVAVVQPLGAFAQRLHFRDLGAQGRAGAVRADQRAERAGHGIGVVAEGGDMIDEVHLLQRVVEMQARTVRFGDVEQHDIELATTDRVNHFRIIAPVALQTRRAVQRVHITAAHHHCLLQHCRIGTRLAQCMQAALGQCQVD